MEDKESDHLRYRETAVIYMSEHESDFAPFVPEEASFQDYTAKML